MEPYRLETEHSPSMKMFILTSVACILAYFLTKTVVTFKVLLTEPVVETVMDEEEEAEEQEEQEEEEEEEEEPEAALEEFEFDGKTFYRDEENNVYTVDDDGDLVPDAVGRWLVKSQKIKFFTKA